MRHQGMSIWDLTPDDLIEGETVQITDGALVYTVTIGRATEAPSPALGPFTIERDGLVE